MFWGLVISAALTWSLTHDPDSERHVDGICASLERFADQVPTDRQWDDLKVSFEGLEAAVMRCMSAGHEIYRTSPEFGRGAELDNSTSR